MLLDLSLAGLRQKLYDLRSTQSSGASQDERINRAINLALQKLSSDVPAALNPDVESVLLYPDVVSTDADVLAAMSTTADNRVLQITNSDATQIDPSTDWAPTVTGEWDGLMHIEATSRDGRTYRRRSREWWVSSGGDYYVSLVKPWTVTADLLMSFRIYQPEFFLPSTVILAEDATINDSSQAAVTHKDAGSRTRLGLRDYQGAGNGVPGCYMRTSQFQLQAPRLAPAVASHASDAWAGPMPQGTFVVYYTIVWGRAGYRMSPEGIIDPLFESAPSPPATFTNPDINAMVISTLSLDAMAGFDITSSLREGRSGYRIRIYIGRTAVGGKGTHHPPFTRIETSGIPYLLAEVEPTAMVGTSHFAAYTWDGSTIPDYERPLPHSTGHYGYTVHPHQDALYELDVPVCKAPRPLLDDQDTPAIRQEAHAIFLELCLHYAALTDGNDQEGAATHLRHYQADLRKFRRHHANPAGTVEPVPFSVGGSTTGFRVGRFSDE